jgi:hypothetical protein
MAIVRKPAGRGGLCALPGSFSFFGAFPFYRMGIAGLPVADVHTFFLDRFVAGFTMGAVK